MMLILLHNIVFGIFLSGGGEVHEKPSLLSVNPGLIIWTIVVFLIFLFLLRRFAWGPLITALNNREETIKTALENAEKQNKETAEMLETNRKIIAEANQQASKILSDARELSAKIKDEIVSKANEEANRNIQKAKEQIQSMKDTALDQMKDDITDIAFKAAGKIIAKNLDKNKQMDIIDEFMNKIPKN